MCQGAPGKAAKVDVSGALECSNVLVKANHELLVQLWIVSGPSCCCGGNRLLQGAALKLALTAASQAIVKFCLLVSCGLFQVLLVAVVVM